MADKELTAYRTYTQKLFETGKNQYKKVCHVGHIHYRKDDGNFDGEGFDFEITILRSGFKKELVIKNKTKLPLYFKDGDGTVHELAFV